ncbi:MAG TPA: FtsH protease activity modulator HflK [Devosiaceae bacterium]|jgi:membrane protease subunit HflK|nr:FtsH protease activity modulator HflK [Devosiaceae bacterium]
MPWDNNTGGGRGNSGGPWGQPSGGGGPRRSGGTPSLEELLSRGRDRFGGQLPGGRWGILGVVVVLVGLWVSQSFYTVAPQEVGVELLLGKPQPQLSQPGLHFLFWPIETVERVVTTENQTEIGSVASGANRRDNEGLMLSADQNIVDVKFSVLWSVRDPAKYLFDVRDPEDMVRAAGESAMREVVGRRPAQDIFRDARADIATEVQRITQGVLDSYGTGVRIDQIAIENVAPPAEVADAYDEVQRAEQDEDRFQEEARQYANTLLGNARGQASQIRENAAAYKDQVVKQAQGEAARFTSIYDQYAKAPEVTRERLYLETMEQVMGGANKVIVDKGASSVVPYLPLPQLQPAQPPARPAAGAGTNQNSNGASNPLPSSPDAVGSPSNAADSNTTMTTGN